MYHRKHLRLQDFDYSENGAYFITICTKEKAHILSNISPQADVFSVPQVRLTAYGRIAEKYLQSIDGIDKYVIMPNHIHMILSIDSAQGPMWASAPTKSISERVRSFKTLVSKEIGQPIWQRSFYDHVIRNEKDYQQVWQYIDNNPAKWADDEYYSG